jgi:hypothetical protein
MRIRDPGWRQFGSGMEKSRIRDKHPGSATLQSMVQKDCVEDPDTQAIDTRSLQTLLRNTTSVYIAD